jgi:mannitol 2-dehydrogenase
MSGQIRVCAENLAELGARKKPAIEIPVYARSIGYNRICHIGVGGFHRAHQAWYLHRLLQEGLAAGWSICGIGLLPADAEMHRRLGRQDCLYSLVEADEQGSRLTVIGSIMDHVYAGEDSRQAVSVMAHRDTHIISLTITEAGYCLRPDGVLDLDNPQIAADLARAESPRTAPGLIVAALRKRRDTGLGGLTVMSCDNLIGNGRKLRSTVLGFAAGMDDALEQWIANEASFPSSMVDRITPALDTAARRALCDRWKLDDEVPVLCEPWRQWVLEDTFVAGRPPLQEAGVVFSADVGACEDAKVGLLNGGHSALCHLGLLCGYTTVCEALADAGVEAWVRCYMREVTGTLPPVPGLHLDDYQTATLRRFANPVLGDRLLRLAQDTSLKFRQALMPPLAKRLDQDREIPCLSAALALWITYLASLETDAPSRATYLDANRDHLITLGSQAFGLCEPGNLLQTALHPEQRHCERLVTAVKGHLKGIRAHGAMNHLRNTGLMQ